MARSGDTLERARAAASEHRWPEARALFAAVDEGALTAADLEAKADASWWTSALEDSMEVRRKAYAAHLAAGDVRRAAFNAWFLSNDHDLVGEVALASGWKMRAARDIATEPPSREHGLLALFDANGAHARGDQDEALAIAARTIELARGLGDEDLLAYAVECLGRYQISGGRVDEGMRLLDESMTSVLAGLTAPLFTGIIFCDVLGATVEAADLRRASEWTEAAARWYGELSGLSPFHGLCRIHRVEIATLRGRWAEAEEDARRASDELATIRPTQAAAAIYALGEINRRRGDLAAAEASFERAHRMGHEPQPGLALLRLRQGKPDVAAQGLRLPLAGSGSHPLGRAWLLSAHVEVSLANGDNAAAAAACDELERIADAWHSPVLEATALTACAARWLVEGDLEAAASAAARARGVLTDIKLPYEAALTRLVIGVASRAAGDEDRARMEIAAARDDLDALGARLDAARAAELLGEGHTPGGLSGREVEVLRHVAAGKTNREIAAEMVLSEHTIGRHLQNIFRKLGVSSRAAATAFAVEKDLV